MRIHILSLFFIIITFSSFAQLVNVEKKRIGNEKKGLQGKIDLSINFTKNNSEILLIKNTNHLQYFYKKNKFLLFNEFSRIKADNKSYLNDGFFHFRYNYNFEKSFIVGEAFTQYQYNKVKKLKHRYLIGAGPRFRILDSTNIRLFSGLLYMYEYEMLTINNQTSSKVRLSAYLAFSLKVTDKITFNHTTYYQPHIVDFSNYRVASETNFTFKISDKLAMKTIYTLNYDSEPPTAVDNLFYTISNGLSYSF